VVPADDKRIRKGQTGKWASRSQSEEAGGRLSGSLAANPTAGWGRNFVYIPPERGGKKDRNRKTGKQLEGEGVVLGTHTFKENAQSHRGGRDNQRRSAVDL